MPYDYIQRTYGLTFKPGQRVHHTESRSLGEGVVTREKPSEGNYVQVRFGDRKHSSPCHPQELEVVGGTDE